jgi:hypothetical protein
MPAALDEFWQLQCFGQNLIETVQIIFIPRQRLIFLANRLAWSPLSPLLEA